MLHHNHFQAQWISLIHVSGIQQKHLNKFMTPSIGLKRNCTQILINMLIESHYKGDDS